MVVLAVAGCRTVRPVAETIETVKDSTVTTVRYVMKDTIIRIPGDSIKFTVPYYTLSEIPIERKAGRATARISAQDENITVECLVEEYEKVITYQNEIIETLREINRNKQTTIKEPVPFVPWYTKTLAWIGGVATVLIIGSIAFKFLKP